MKEEEMVCFLPLQSNMPCMKKRLAKVGRIKELDKQFKVNVNRGVFLKQKD
jgi:hypothetical protein